MRLGVTTFIHRLDLFEQVKVRFRCIWVHFELISHSRQPKGLGGEMDSETAGQKEDVSTETSVDQTLQNPIGIRQPSFVEKCEANDADSPDGPQTWAESNVSDDSSLETWSISICQESEADTAKENLDPRNGFPGATVENLYKEDQLPGAEKSETNVEGDSNPEEEKGAHGSASSRVCSSYRATFLQLYRENSRVQSTKFRCFFLTKPSSKLLPRQDYKFDSWQKVAEKWLIVSREHMKDVLVSQNIRYLLRLLLVVHPQQKLSETFSAILKDLCRTLLRIVLKTELESLVPNPLESNLLLELMKLVVLHENEPLILHNSLLGGSDRALFQIPANFCPLQSRVTSWETICLLLWLSFSQ